MSKYIPTESDEQRVLLEWGAYHKLANHKCVSDYLIHIPNGGSRNPIEAKNLKKAGVKAGVSDLFLAYPSGKYHGLWIELKRIEGARASVSQLDWIAKMRAVGYQAKVCYGFEAARDVILEYLG